MIRHTIRGRALSGLGFLAAIGTPACRPSPPAATAATAEPAIPVVLAAVRDTVIVRPIVASGILGVKEEVPLGFKIGGVIARITVDVGETVKAGQLLAVLAEQEIGAEVAKAEAGVTQADRDYVRAGALYQDSVIARDRLESAETGLEVARANLRIARFNETYAAIHAPAAGTVLRRLAEPGQLIAPGTPILLLGTATRGAVVRVGLADHDFGRVRMGDQATIRFDSGDQPPRSGRVVRLAAAASPGTGAWQVEIALERPGTGGNPQLSGLIGRVEITPRNPPSARVIPVAALLEADGDSAVVYSVVGSQVGHRGAPAAKRHLVRVLFIDGERAAIAEGLDGVGEVVTAGAGYLHDGALVAPLIEARSR